jgi:hypothetical protein
MINLYKNESEVIFSCMIIIIIFYCIFLIYNRINKTYTRYTKYKELFLNNDSKRSKMIRLYKDSDILDPDENPNLNIEDPDSTDGRDPDS